MRKFAALVLTLASVLGLSPAAEGPAGAALPGLVPGWARSDRIAGPVGEAEMVELQFVLPWRNRPSLERLIGEVSDPASPRYAQYLTPREFRARFSPREAIVEAVVRWARARGLEIGRIPANRMVVPARGTARSVADAFGTSFARFAVHGLALRAPVVVPSMPAPLAAMGVTVRGLDESSRLLRPGAIDAEPDAPPRLPEEGPTPADTSPPAVVRYAAPCSAFHGATVPGGVPPAYGRRQPAVTCATSPEALRAAYGITPLLDRGIDGRGQTIVMVGSHAIRPMFGDLQRWSFRRGLPPFLSTQFRQVSYPGAYQTPQDPSGSILRPEVWAVQSAMLIETMHAAAPGANVTYFGTVSSLDLEFAPLLVVDQKMGNVVVNGWYGLNEDFTEPDNILMTQIGEQAAAQGITIVFASGDLGDGTKFGNTTPSAAFPATNPLFTTVGATSLILGPRGRYVRELGWAKSTRPLKDGAWAAPEDAKFRGSGGGVSVMFDQPEYQRGVVSDAVARRSDGTLGRAVPDVAVTGDAETGMLIGYTQRLPDGSTVYSERRVAADTAATGLFGAMVALANHLRGHDHGFLNPALYALWRGHRDAYRDVVASGRRTAGVRFDYVNGADAAGGIATYLKTFEDFTSNKPRPGYDTVTGLGSPSLQFFRHLP